MGGAVELAMAMSITQDAFDEVVKESMEGIGIHRKGAAEDFVEQFKARGWYQQQQQQQQSPSKAAGRAQHSS